MGTNYYDTHSTIRNLSPSLAIHRPRLLIVEPSISIVWGTPDINHEPSHCGLKTQFEEAAKIIIRKQNKYKIHINYKSLCLTINKYQKFPFIQHIKSYKVTCNSVSLLKCVFISEHTFFEGEMMRFKNSSHKSNKYCLGIIYVYRKTMLLKTSSTTSISTQTKNGSLICCVYACFDFLNE